MLSILTAHHLEPEIEAIDRDPGIIALAAGLVRTTRRCLSAVSARTRSERDGATEAGPHDATTTWPHRRG